MCRFSSGSPSARIDERMWRLHDNGARILPRFLCFFSNFHASQPESDESAISRSGGRDGPWWANPWATVSHVAGMSFLSENAPELS